LRDGLVIQAGGPQHGARGGPVRSFLYLVTSHFDPILVLSFVRWQKKTRTFLVRVFQVNRGFA
jgi:hypothetical protein